LEEEDMNIKINSVKKLQKNDGSGSYYKVQFDDVDSENSYEESCYQDGVVALNGQTVEGEIKKSAKGFAYLTIPSLSKSSGGGGGRKGGSGYDPSTMLISYAKDQAIVVYAENQVLKDQAVGDITKSVAIIGAITDGIAMDLVALYKKVKGAIEGS
jgi:hypothetical protein